MVFFYYDIFSRASYQIPILLFRTARLVTLSLTRWVTEWPFDFLRAMQSYRRRMWQRQRQRERFRDFNDTVDYSLQIEKPKSWLWGSEWPEQHLQFLQYFLAVQDSSRGDLVTHSVSESVRHLISAMTTMTTVTSIAQTQRFRFKFRATITTMITETAI